MRTRWIRVTTWGVFALFPLLSLGLLWSQEETSQEIQIPSHWSPYDAPTSYPEGTRLHIIVKDDTLWDLANQYFENPFLWPQLWNANRYITNPHWIYPGDPLVIPELEVVRGAEEEAGAPGAPGEPGAEPGVGVPGAPGAAGPQGPTLIPATEEVTIQCAGYVSDKEDEGFRIIGNEQGDGRITMGTGDVVYINRGTDDGISPGDMFYTQRRERKLDAGWHITRTGWVTVLAAQEESAIAEITTACIDVRKNDYLSPFEQIPVPLIQPEPPATRLTPETGQLRGEIAASLDHIGSMGEGNMVSIDLGERDGVIPGNVFTIFRYLYKGVQRKMVGELVVLTVQEETSTARISYSYDYVVTGDQIELK